MERFRINVENIEHSTHSIDHDMEKIEKYFRSIQAKNCQFLVCVMNTKYENDLTRLKINIKRCGTLKYGKLFLTISIYFVLLSIV